MVTTQEKKLTPKQIADRIKRSNAKWKAATPAQKRVMLAKDVIAQAGVLFTPRSGSYVDNMSRNLLEAIREEMCKCCAKGAFAIAAILREGKDPYEVFGVDACESECCSVSRLAFDDPQLFDAVEYVFEDDNVQGRSYNENTRYKIEVMSSELPGDPTDRLIAICKHIIDCEGELFCESA